MVLLSTKKHIPIHSIAIVFLLLTIPFVLWSQDKVLDHPDFAIWNRVQNVKVSDNGAWVGYQLTPG